MTIAGAPRRSLAVTALVLLTACGPLPGPRGPDPDLRPPAVEDVSATGPERLVVTFDEDASLDRETLRVEPALAVHEVSPPGRTVAIGVEVQVPGREYLLEATASDTRGNTTTFLAGFYGFNPRVPRVVLNELTPRGSSDHPDLVELKVLSDGDMGGLVLYAGTPSSFDARLVFPSFEVRAGSFIVVHCRPMGDPAEIDETGDPGVSGGLDASPTARDFWLRGCTGLGGNNGVVSLYERPGGPMLDGRALQQPDLGQRRAVPGVRQRRDAREGGGAGTRRGVAHRGEPGGAGGRGQPRWFDRHPLDLPLVDLGGHRRPGGLARRAHPGRDVRGRKP